MSLISPVSTINLDVRLRIISFKAQKIFLINPSTIVHANASTYVAPPCCSSACAIELGEQVVVTGGSFSHDLVTLYNQQVTSDKH